MTIQDIAQKMNVSIATASKALNGSSDIAEDTRRQIREYAAQVGYRSRKSLSCNGRLALLWGKEIQSGDFGALAKIAEAFCKTAQQERYEVVVKTTTEEGFRLNDYLADHHFYGAFLLDLNFFSPVYAQLKKTRYPLVLLDNYLTDNERISGIGSENILSTECAVDYLVSLGHKKIAFLDGERQSLVSAERLAGYILGLSKNSIEYRCELTYFGDFSRRAGSDAAEYFHCKDFTAAVCASDLMAAGLIDRLREYGKRVPEDISVVGFDDLEVFRLPPYRLTTLRQDFDQIGEKAFRILESMIKGQPSQRCVLGCTLLPRGTTRKLEEVF